MDNKEFDEMRLPIAFLKYGAFVLPNEEKDVSYVYSILSAFGVIAFMLIQIFVWIHLFTSQLAVTPYITITIAFAGSSLQTLVRHIYFLVRRSQISQLIHTIRTSPCNESYEMSVAESNMRMSSTRRIRKYLVAIILHHVGVSVAVITCIFYMPGVMLKDPTKYDAKFTEMWWPVENTSQPLQNLLLLWQGFAVLANTMCSCTMDAFVCGLIMCVAERSAMLTRTAPQALLPAQCNITKHFRAWIKYHQTYLSLFSTTNKLMGHIIFYAHLFGIVNIIIFSYLLMNVDKLSFPLALTYLLSSLLQVYIFSISGQRVKDNSEELGRNTLNSALITNGGLKDGPVRSVLLVLMARCSGAEPEELSGLGYFTVSVSLFSAILGAVVSFVLVLIQLQWAKNKIEA